MCFMLFGVSGLLFLLLCTLVTSLISSQLNSIAKLFNYYEEAPGQPLHGCMSGLCPRFLLWDDVRCDMMSTCTCYHEVSRQVGGTSWTQTVFRLLREGGGGGGMIPGRLDDEPIIFIYIPVIQFLNHCNVFGNVSLIN